MFFTVQFEHQSSSLTKLMGLLLISQIFQNVFMFRLSLPACHLVDISIQLKALTNLWLSTLTFDFLLSYTCVHRDQPGDSCKSSGHCQHATVAPDAQILEGKTSDFKETGWTLF